MYSGGGDGAVITRDPLRHQRSGGTLAQPGRDGADRGTQYYGAGRGGGGNLWTVPAAGL